MSLAEKSVTVRKSNFITRSKVLTAVIKLLLSVFVVIVTILMIPVLVLLFFIYLINKKLAIQGISILGSFHWKLELLFLNLSADVKILGLEKIDRNKNYIVCANHLCTVDYLLTNLIADSQNNLCFLKYVLKYSLISMPVLGQAMYFGGFCFLTRNYVKDKKYIEEWAALFKKIHMKIWPVIYPEGTRTTPKKRQEGLEFCKKNNLKMFEHTLYPRKRGFEMLKNGFKGQIEDVLCLTFYYSKNKMPKFSDIFFKSKLKGEFTIVVDILKNEEETDAIKVFETINSNISELKRTE